MLNLEHETYTIMDKDVQLQRKNTLEVSVFNHLAKYKKTIRTRAATTIQDFIQFVLIMYRSKPPQHALYHPSSHQQ